WGQTVLFNHDLPGYAAHVLANNDDVAKIRRNNAAAWSCGDPVLDAVAIRFRARDRCTDTISPDRPSVVRIHSRRNDDKIALGADRLQSFERRRLDEHETHRNPDVRRAETRDNLTICLRHVWWRCAACCWVARNSKCRNRGRNPRVLTVW